MCLLVPFASHFDSPPETPSELRVDAKWDRCVEMFLINFGTGLVAGGLAGAVFASKEYISFVADSVRDCSCRTTGGRVPRAAWAAFGAGTGVGSAWEKSDADFSRRSS